MEVDTGNFHVFFPKGCFREKPSPRRNQLFAALDKLIAEEHFDLETFHRVKKAFLRTIGTDAEDAAFNELNKLITPLFSLMLQQDFSKEELQNYEVII